MGAGKTGQRSTNTHLTSLCTACYLLRNKNKNQVSVPVFSSTPGSCLLQLVPILSLCHRLKGFTVLVLLSLPAQGP